MQKYLPRFASIELSSSSYITDKENGSSNTHGKILGISSNFSFYGFIRPILLTIFWKTISILQNTIIEGRLLPCEVVLLCSVFRIRVCLEKILIIGERVIIVLEGILSFIGRISMHYKRKEASEIRITFHYIRKEVVVVPLLYGETRELYTDFPLLYSKTGIQ